MKLINKRGMINYTNEEKTEYSHDGSPHYVAGEFRQFLRGADGCSMMLCDGIHWILSSRGETWAVEGTVMVKRTSFGNRTLDANGKEKVRQIREKQNG